MWRLGLVGFGCEGLFWVLSIEVKGFKVADARAEVVEVEVGCGGAKLWEISDYWSRF